MMSPDFPKAVKVWMAANLLAIEFDNGQTRYMRTHYMDNYVSAWSPKRGKGNRLNLLMAPTWAWFGSNARVEPNGAVILFDKDVYTPQELWENSQEQINLVSGVKGKS